MKVSALKKVLSENAGKALTFRLPNTSTVPVHFHVTEVGKLRKDFIDCGGTVRAMTVCTLQLWVAHDVEHRLIPEKLEKIMGYAAPLLGERDLDVVVEYQQASISLFDLESCEVDGAQLVFQLQTKSTACLAPELCLPGSGCC